MIYDHLIAIEKFKAGTFAIHHCKNSAKYPRKFQLTTRCNFRQQFCYPPFARSPSSLPFAQKKLNVKKKGKKKISNKNLDLERKKFRVRNLSNIRARNTFVFFLFFFLFNFVTSCTRNHKGQSKREYRDDTAQDLQPLRNSNRGIWNVWKGTREKISMRMTL